MTTPIDIKAKVAEIAAGDTPVLWITSLRIPGRGTEIKIIRGRNGDHSPPAEMILPDDTPPVFSLTVFPAERFMTMPPQVRAAFKHEYHDYLLARIALAKGKDGSGLDPWKDYDPIQVEEDVQRWIDPNVRWTGD